MRRQLLSATAAAALALLCCACLAHCSACAGAAGRDCGRPLLTAELQQLLRVNYSEDSAGVRYCTETRRRRSASRDAEAELAFRFDTPGLDLMWCKAERQAAAKKGGGGAAYVVLVSGTGDSTSRFKCGVCNSGWYQFQRDHVQQQPEGQCGVDSLRPPIRLEGLPAGPGARLDGVRCYSAVRKGCGPGYAWCHGACCRLEALFYYPQLQQPIGSGKLLTEENAGPREAPLLRLLTTAQKKSVADC